VRQARSLADLCEHWTKPESSEHSATALSERSRVRAQHPYACALLIGRSLATIRFALVCSCGVCKSKLLRRHSPVFALLACSTQPSACSTSLCLRFAHWAKSRHNSLCAGIKKGEGYPLQTIKKIT